MVAKLFDRRTWAVGLGTGIGYSNLSSSSWIVGAILKEGRLGPEQASFVVTAEMLAMGATMLLLAPMTPRIPRKIGLLVAVICLIGAQLVSSAQHDFLGLAVTRAFSGLAFGLVYNIAIGIGAEALNPQRVFAGAATIALVVGTAFNPLLGWGSSIAGYAGVVFGLSGYCALLAVPLLCLPLVTAPGPARTTDGASSQVSNQSLIALMVLGIMALLTTSYHGTLLFSVPIAESVGLKGAGLGSGLALVSLLSASGGAVAAWIGTRFGKFPPIAIGLVAMAAVLAIYPVPTGAWMFWVNITAAVGLFWFLSPYIFGLAVDADRSGRLASGLGSIKIFCTAIGAGGAGIITDRWGVVWVGYVSAVICLGSILLAYFVVRALESGPSANRQSISPAMTES